MGGRETSPSVFIAIGAAIAALLLPVSLFLDWYEFSSGGVSVTLSGWEALETSDALLFLIGVAAIVAVLRPLLTRTPAHPPLALVALGGTAVVIVLSLLIWDIPFVELTQQSPGTDLDVDVKVGGWVAIIGAVGLLVAALLDATVRRKG